MSDIMAYLKENGHEIGNAARNGNQAAIDIIQWYRIMSSTPHDAGARAILSEMVKRYMAESAADHSVAQKTK